VVLSATETSRCRAKKKTLLFELWSHAWFDPMREKRHLQLLLLLFHLKVDDSELRKVVGCYGRVELVTT
jgi:hypothetical protein